MSTNALGNTYPGKGGGKAVYFKAVVHNEAGTEFVYEHQQEMTRSHPGDAVALG